MMILVINCGSSSIKYKLFDMTTEAQLATGLIERIGEPHAKVHHEVNSTKFNSDEPIADYESGVKMLLRLLMEIGQPPPLHSIAEINGVGHRVVHGGEAFHQSTVIDDTVIATIDRVSDLAPLHNPANLAGIRAAMHNLTDRPHVAVFDTAFFQTMPPESYVYALPYEWYTGKGIRRYGFHGTSHRYVTYRAAKLLGKTAPNLVTLHLGNGCSATCVREGMAIDQTMGLTPLEGLVMGTRCGDIDPAIIFHLIRSGMSLSEVHQSMEKKGGLLGISGLSRDMRDVHKAAQQGHQRAALAINVFAHRVRKYLGAFLAELGHCDAVVFTGGIGEGAFFIREKVLSGLDSLGIVFDRQRNEQHSRNPFLVTADGSPIAGWVIPTNEELMIARDTLELIA